MIKIKKREQQLSGNFKWDKDCIFEIAPVSRERRREIITYLINTRDERKKSEGEAWIDRYQIENTGGLTEKEQLEYTIYAQMDMIRAWKGLKLKHLFGYDNIPGIIDPNQVTIEGEHTREEIFEFNGENKEVLVEAGSDSFLAFLSDCLTKLEIRTADNLKAKLKN